jgi:glycosyltransferase involved in cell wall biosynthesis
LRLEDVSAVVTSHNDASTIGDCLESARVFGSTVVVDAFSTDGTVEIARKAGAVVYSRAASNAAEQKNWALSRAPGRWVLSLDACETVGDGLRERIEGADAGADGYTIRVQNEYLGKVMTSRAAGYGEVVRLFVNGASRFAPDETDATGASVVTEGKVAELDADLRRREFRDIHLHFEAINRGTTAAARVYADGGGRLSPARMLLHPTFVFWQLYLFRGGIRDGARGLMYCMLRAYESFIRYAKAWEFGVGRRRERELRRGQSG